MAIHASPTIDLECLNCHVRFEMELLEATGAGRLVCPTCKAVGETPADLALLGAFEQLLEVVDGAKCSFTLNGLHLADKARLRSRAPRSTDDEETTTGWAQLRYETALEALRAGRWQEAFKAALDAQQQIEGAAQMIASATCHKCKKRISSTAEWSAAHRDLYLRGLCPRCETVLRISAP